MNKVKELPNTLPSQKQSLDYLEEVVASGTLPELLEWWKDRKGRGQALFEMRPKIDRSKTKNTGICVSAEVLERAKAKAVEDKKATGGSLSQLIELLLWQYIGSPEDLLSSE